MKFPVEFFAFEQFVFKGGNAFSATGKVGFELSFGFESLCLNLRDATAFLPLNGFRYLSVSISCCIFNPLLIRKINSLTLKLDAKILS